MDDYFPDHRASVKFQDVGDEDEDLEREVSTKTQCNKRIINVHQAFYAL